ncbi:glycosyltransferase [Shewanella sp. MBTL60-007]|uniref:glycosyltransferase n=1 Tax=Shewanella sp. MBTL60-007 TaxID=2815911 RepID=UPI001BC09770|nr:glycosyltransferase [Shewanella sp. MBTL60-007]GIU33383.1 alpha-L-Rha alpha-1,3-L-rhamnosyltransferase [Shewanella sp. MBTL60-007]
MINVSVAMAVYNGSSYINEQIDSILNQLKINDELVISYDESQDNTFDIISAYASKDARVKVFKNFGSGVVSNFENAIRNTQGEYIFLSDQDDVWSEDKIEIVMREFVRTGADAIAHDYKLVDENLKPLNLEDKSGFELRGGSSSIIKNLVRLSYIGCCLAFKRNMKSYILPIPTKQRSHDWWIGTMTGLIGKFLIINDKLILHRMHMNNATPKSRPPLTYQFEVRSIILFNAIKRAFVIKGSADDFKN